ncbi:MAG: hypothetical protein ACRD96_06455, partial [Bryobacteraceae bacterium]
MSCKVLIGEAARKARSIDWQPGSPAAAEGDARPLYFTEEASNANPSANAEVSREGQIRAAYEQGYR